MAKTTVTITPEDISLTGAPNWIQFNVTEYSSDAYIEIDVQDGDGKHLAALQKSCSKGPVWFNLNSVFKSYNSYKVPPASPGWFDTGTGHPYRITAKLVEGSVMTTVYESPVLYALQGYALPSEELNMSKYQYSANGFTLLTNRPITYHVAGQKEFISFLTGTPYLTVSPVSLSFPTSGGSQSVTINSNTSWRAGGATRAKSTPVPIDLKILYKALTTSGADLGTVEAQAKTEMDTTSVSTCLLDIDTVLAKYPKAGIVRVSVVEGSKMVSNELEYRIHPTALHQLRPVYFVNKLGGWDAFNFDAPVKEEVSSEMDTYSRSFTPTYAKGDSLEAVARTSLKNTYTIEGAPVSDDVARWLKELALSRIVLDGDGNYIIIEEFKLTIDPENRDMQIPTIKYKLSETYING